ncbi:MAG: YihA family ribosome biogenesis GTP-binding protein [Bacteroidales bacterium]|nr:YihA family ribosome biogenesis GTP-binding protein [Bacteroidales bacterium]
MIKTAEFFVSNSDYKKCPKHEAVEIAFIGRSNVGKSSLINMLCGQNKLAKISSSPGKTQLINHFIINQDWYLVDLPGYGFAKVSKSMREQFDKLIRAYILNREELDLLFVLIDSRLEPQKNDLDFINWLGENGIPFMIIFTKADKLSSSKLNKNLLTFKKKMLLEWEEMPRFFVTSSSDGRGKDELLTYIDELLKTLSKLS